MAAEFYGPRYDVEHDIRDMKVSLGIENIRVSGIDLNRQTWRLYNRAECSGGVLFLSGGGSCLKRCGQR